MMGAAGLYWQHVFHAIDVFEYWRRGAASEEINTLIKQYSVRGFDGFDEYSAPSRRFPISLFAGGGQINNRDCCGGVPCNLNPLTAHWRTARLLIILSTPHHSMLILCNIRVMAPARIPNLQRATTVPGYATKISVQRWADFSALTNTTVH